MKEEGWILGVKGLRRDGREHGDGEKEGGGVWAFEKLISKIISR